MLSSELADYNAQVDQLAGEVAVLRNREAIVIGELRRIQARLNREKDHLERAQGSSSRRSLNVLRQRLVGIYRSGSPDLLTVMLESDGFDDLVSRYEYLRRIEEQDSSIVSRVRTLRNGTRLTVEQVTEDRNEIEEKKAELERTRAQLEAREAELAAVRDQKAAALDEVELRTSSSSRATSPTFRTRSSSRSRPASETPGVAPLQAGPGPGRQRRLDLAGQRHPDLAVRLSLGTHARGDRHLGPRGHPDPRREGGHRDPRRLHRRLRQLHLRRSRRRALVLLRPPVELRRQPAATRSTRAR